MKRRKYLKSAGVSAIGLTGVGTMARATSDSWQHRMRIYQTARTVLKRTGSVKKFREYLADHGIPYGSSDYTFEVQKPHSSDGVSEQYLDKEDLQIWLTISQPACNDYPNRYTGEVSFDWSQQGADDWGEDPKDAVGITFSDRHFYIPDLDGDEYWLDDWINYSNQGSEGIGFGVEDEAADTAGKLSAGTQLRWNDATNESADQRFLYATYTHSYGDSVHTWSSIGFSVGAISLTFDSGFNGGTWDTNEDHNDVPLKVSAADANCILP